VNGRAHQPLARGRTPCALLALATVGLLGAAPLAAGAARAGEGPTAARPSDVARLYAAKCGSCHGPDGRGTDLRATAPDVPDFASPAWQQGHTDKEIAGKIAAGSSPGMPAFRDKLTEEQIRALAAHLRTFAAPARKAPAHARALRLAAAPTAEQLYKDAGCVDCHDKDGRGRGVRKAMPAIPDFTDGKWHKAHADDGELARSILEGKGKFMTAQKEKLSKEDVNRLVAYVRRFTGGKQAPADRADGPPDAPTAREGAALFRARCANCHGQDGRGGEAALPRLPDFASPSWQASRSDAQLSVSILEGKGALMPPFRDKLGAGQARAVLAHVRALAPANPRPDLGAEPDAFDEQFRRLAQEFEELMKQLDELKKPKGP
jgi:mono/diheme cytochrome c family protein